MITRETKLTILSEILKSAEFANSNTYQKLLTYLVKSSINDITPKEYSIAVDVFGKDSDFNPGIDSTVRVYIGKLRKKLANYYRDEGKKANVRLEIPKGHYEVRFTKHTQKRAKEFFHNANVLFSAIIGLLLLMIFYLLIKNTSLNRHVNQKQIQLSRSVVWTDILSSKRSKLIVLGDDFFFLDKIDKEETIIRKHYINSLDAFKRYEQRHPEKKGLEKTPYAFIPRISVWPLPEIIQMFKPDVQINLDYSSHLETDALLKNDIIFLGSFRNLYLLDQAFKFGGFDFKLGADTSFIKINTPDTNLTFTRTGFPDIGHTDYCLMRKIPGPNHNSIILFVSFFEIGITGAVHYVTHEETLKEIENAFQEKYDATPEYFDILFKTTGYSRTAFTTHIEYIARINPQTNIW